MSHAVAVRNYIHQMLSPIQSRSRRPSFAQRETPCLAQRRRSCRAAGASQTGAIVHLNTSPLSPPVAHVGSSLSGWAGWAGGRSRKPVCVTRYAGASPCHAPRAPKKIIITPCSVRPRIPGVFVHARPRTPCPMSPAESHAIYMSKRQAPRNDRNAATRGRVQSENYGCLLPGAVPYWRPSSGWLEPPGCCHASAVTLVAWERQLNMSERGGPVGCGAGAGVVCVWWVWGCGVVVGCGVQCPASVCLSRPTPPGPCLSFTIGSLSARPVTR